VPVHLRDGHYSGSKSIGHGVGYQYSHDSPEGIASQDYLGVERQFYEPVERGAETEMAQRYRSIKELLKGPKDSRPQ
ncbi:MAG: replication-associated recombination protein A, partial [Pirellula sp.]